MKNGRAYLGLISVLDAYGDGATVNTKYQSVPSLFRSQFRSFEHNRIKSLR